jgi:hypothetical protein
VPYSARIFALATDAITVEGALIAPVLLARVAAQQADSQSNADYRIPKGLTLRDEIARNFRIGQALFAELNASPAPSTVKTIDFVEVLFRDVFGFSDMARVGTRTVNDRLFAVTLEGLRGRVPVVVVPPSDPLDRASDHLPTDGRRRSAASAVQDWLNAREDALWGFCCNGDRLRLLRDNASLTRPAYIEADLRRIFEAEAFADFTLLWLLIHASRFGLPDSTAADCTLERWREAGSRVGAVARDRLRDGVEAALKVLGTGFLAGNLELRQRVQSSDLPLGDFFGQLLRLIYRLIFLLVAEDRGLLHDPGASQATRSLYARGYSVSSLRDRAVRRTAWDCHHDKWEGLTVVFSALARGEKLLGLPALGGLFAPDMMSDLESAHLLNRALMEAIFRLAWLREDAGLVPVNWRDMETEELGSVYESLLELTPLLIEDGREFVFAEGGEAKGHARKTTGSYYTPDSLVQVLLDSALDPVLDRVQAKSDDPSEALLGVTAIDPACGSGHFLLAAGRRIATRLARARAGGVASAEDFRHALRDVARACLYGVDRNPMAVELTKVALWIETVEPGKPLGFLDANIRCGDALLGVFDIKALKAGIPEAAYKPLTRDDKSAARYYAARNRDDLRGQGSLDFARGGGRFPATPLATAWSSLRALPEDSPEQVAEKRRFFEAVRADRLNHAWGVAADLYIAAFLLPKSEEAPAVGQVAMVPTTSDVWCALADSQVHPPLVARATEASREARAFHWPLEFPDVIAAGGFDVVLGNPPWERIKLQEQEFFASLDTEIATAPNAAARSLLIAALANAELGTRERSLNDEFEKAKRLAEASSVFARESGRFPLTGRGDVNTYALFAEFFASLTSSRGRAGVIVPTGIATDATTAPFFAALIDGKRLVRLIDFENRNRIFSAIDSRIKFSLLTIGRDISEADYAFFLTDPAQLAEPERRFTLSASDIARINPNNKTTPVFRARADKELAAKIYSRVPILMDDSKGAAGDPWSFRYMTKMFDMADSSSRFRTAAQLTEVGLTRVGTDWISGGDRHLRYIPLYEAKMISFFDHRAASYAERGNERGYRVLPESSDEQHSDPAYEVEPFYWLLASDFEARLVGRPWNRPWLMGWKDVAAVTNERTVLATAFPRVAVGHTIRVMFVDGGQINPVNIIANLSSLMLDYIARLKFGGLHLTVETLKQLPVLPPSAYSESDNVFVQQRALELIYTSHSMRPFARDLGYEGPPFGWDEDRRALLRAELDAFYARAYGLTRNELRYILDPEDAMGVGYPSETFRVLKTNEIRRFGEYRTARLVLDAWDRTERGEARNTTSAIPGSIGQIIAGPPSVPIDLSVLPDGAWTRPGQPQPGDIGAVLTALLKALDGPKPIRNVRLAAVLVLEPRLLIPLLPKVEASEWRRLVGSEADPLPGNVAAFATRINAAWGAVVRNHRGNGRLIEDLGSNTWTSGSGLEAVDTRGWPDGRAGFVLDTLKNIHLGTAATSLPSEIQQWIANAAAA